MIIVKLALLSIKISFELPIADNIIFLTILGPILQNIFTSVFYGTLSSKLHFHPVLTFEGLARSLPLEWIIVHLSKLQS